MKKDSKVVQWVKSTSLKMVDQV